MNCDRIAPFYQAVETMAFGTRLQRHRLAFLGGAANKQRALILGDGDGRFTQQLAITYPTLRVDSIDLSFGMLAQARKRLAEHANVSLIQADALRCPLPFATYDIVFTHFFLDCFKAEELAKLIPGISQSLCAEATWIITDFRQASGGWRSLYTRAWLHTMYSFFRLATGLRTRQLASYKAELSRAQFSLLEEQTSFDGLITSERWQR